MHRKSLPWAASVTGVSTALLLISLLTARTATVLSQSQPMCGEGCYCAETEVTGGGVTICTRCECPGGTTPGPETPGPSTPVPWTPAPTVTPLPSNAQEVCWAANCPPGQSRLTHFTFDAYGALVNTFYIEGCCGPSCPCPQDPTHEEPVTVPGDHVQGTEYGACVSLSLPVWYVDRRPYPRGMVQVPNMLSVVDLPAAEAWSGAVDPDGSACHCRADGSCAEDAPAEGTLCDFRLGLRTVPSNQAPSWVCEDSGKGTAFEITCTWPHSSAGKAYEGKGLGCEALPAFRVTASLPYWWYIGRQWHVWEQVGENCSCVCKVCEDPRGCADQCDCHGDGSLCIHDDEFCDRDCEPVYGWVQQGPNWELLDLRDYGHPTPYMVNGNVQLVDSRACGPHPVGSIWVPIIEVQGVISNPKE